MKRAHLSLLSLSICATLSAQNVAVPSIFANAEGGTSGNIWRNGINRVQGFYDTANFAGQGIDSPIDIGRVQWRAAGGLTGTAGSYPAVDIFLGYSATDFLAPSTTFATNRTASHTLCYSGPVAFAVAAGTTPNSWYIDLPLTTAFRYDPSLGQDLLIEIVINGTPTITPATLSCGFNAAAHLCNSVRSVGSTTATTGSVSAFAPVVNLFYTEPPGVGRRENFGTGCIDQAVSYYELFAPGTFDLGGSSGVTNSIQMVPNASGGYTVLPGSNTWATPTSPDLLLGDDAVSAAQPLSFAFAHPGGSTMAVIVGSNGHLWLGAAGATTPVGTPTTLFAEPARLSPYWTDLDPSAATGAGSVHFEEDVARGAAYVTWQNVPMWEATPSVPRFLNNVQVALFDTGVVEFRYQDCNAPTYAIITGFTPGGGARDGGSVDISGSMPLVTGPDMVPLGLSAASRPVTGTSVDLVTTAIPTGTVLSANILSFSEFLPGLPLDLLGMPGCFQFVALHNSTILFGTGSQSRSLSIPNDLFWVGTVLRSQTASLVPGINAFGALSSNAVRLTIGSL